MALRELQLQFDDGTIFKCPDATRDEPMGAFIQRLVPVLAKKHHVNPTTKYLANAELAVIFAQVPVHPATSLGGCGLADGAQLQVLENPQQRLITTHPLGPQGPDFATNGVLYCLGTKGGTQSYQNPHQMPDGVVASVSSTLGCSTHALSSEVAPQFVNHMAPNNTLGRSYATGYLDCCPWMAVDLGPSRTLVLEGYAVRHGEDGLWCHKPFCWFIQASNDAENWTTLKTHYCGPWPDNGFDTNKFELATDEHSLPYQHFRIYQPCPNCTLCCCPFVGWLWGGPLTLMCAGIELYGELNQPTLQAPGNVNADAQPFLENNGRIPYLVVRP